MLPAWSPVSLCSAILYVAVRCAGCACFVLSGYAACVQLMLLVARSHGLNTPDETLVWAGSMHADQQHLPGTTHRASRVSASATKTARCPSSTIIMMLHVDHHECHIRTYTWCDMVPPYVCRPPPAQHHTGSHVNAHSRGETTHQPRHPRITCNTISRR